MGNELISRRTFLFGSAAIVVGACSCERRFVRPGGHHDLGLVTTLFYSKKYLLDKAMLIFRDERGWSALSARCSYDGCDLTFQDQVLYCSCCMSTYDHRGNVLRGPSVLPLPWYEIYYKDKHLFANSGKEVSYETRFTTPQIEDAIRRLGLEGKVGNLREGGKIPKVLLGEGDGTKGDFFKFPNPDTIEKPLK